jgi:hypothetical protein
MYTKPAFRRFRQTWQGKRVLKRIKMVKNVKKRFFEAIFPEELNFASLLIMSRLTR